MKVSLYDNIKQVTTPPKLIEIGDILSDILSGKYKKEIQELRSDTDNSDLKRQLPCVVFSGEMTNPVTKITRSTNKQYTSYRDDDSLAVHSGYCVIDLDHVTDIEKTKEVLCNIDEVYSVFISPSGNGLKVIYKIPSNIKKHRGYYKSILLDLEALGIKVDTTSINESRLCFVSWDADLYLNEYAETYMTYIEDASDIIVIDKKVDASHVLTDYSKLTVAATMIDVCDDGYKHHTLIRASYLMGGYIASGTVREDDAVNMLRSRILSRNISDREQAFKTIADGIEQGKQKPIYEIEELENSFKTYLAKAEFEDEQRGYSFLVDNKEVDEKMMSYILHGAVEGFSTGSEELDRHFVFKENTFNVILGHDNVGKSLATWFLAICSSALHGWKWIIYSPENKIHRIKKQMIDFILGKQSNSVSPEVFNKAKQFVDTHFMFLRKDKEYNVFELLEYGELICRNDPLVKGFLIDPYNSLSLDYKMKGKGLSAYEYHLKAATYMRIFSERFCSIYLNGHSVTGSRRNMFDSEGNLLRPKKDDMEQGGLWANRADDFMVVHRKVKSPTEWMYTEFHIDKVKDTETGGRVTFDEPVRFQLMYNSDFVDDSGVSPLREWRKSFFFGEQTKMQLPTIDPQDAF